MFTIHLHAATDTEDGVRSCLSHMNMTMANLAIVGLEHVNVSVSKLDMDAPEEPDWEQEYKDLRAAVEAFAETLEQGPQQYKKKIAYQLRDIL